MSSHSGSVPSVPPINSQCFPCSPQMVASLLMHWNDVQCTNIFSYSLPACHAVCCEDFYILHYTIANVTAMHFNASIVRTKLILDIIQAGLLCPVAPRQQCKEMCPLIIYCRLLSFYPSRIFCKACWVDNYHIHHLCAYLLCVHQ